MDAVATRVQQNSTVFNAIAQHVQHQQLANNKILQISRSTEIWFTPFARKDRE